MVKYSKYLFALIILILAYEGKAQNNIINRDKEICRITLENFLKQWDEATILNRIEDSKASYNQSTLTFEVEAPNAEVFLNAQRGIFKDGDEEVMNTFYNKDVIALQQERLLAATGDFIKDFHSYLPPLKAEETIAFKYKVADREKKDKSGNQIELRGAENRKYNLSIAWKMKDIKEMASGSIDQNEFAQRATISK